MTTPVDPASMGSSAAPVQVPAASPTDDEIRDLAAQLMAMATPDFTPSALLKGVVVSSDFTVSPSLATITLMGSTTQIAGVLIADNVTCVAGDVVNVTMQGNKLQITGRVAAAAGDNGGWTQATLSSGFTHNGDSQGNVEYRLIQDNGSAKMQWRGAAAISNSNTTVVSGLGTAYRPSSQRKLIGARGMGNGAAVLGIQFQFTTAGAVVIAGGTYAIPTHSHYLGYTDTQLSGYLSYNQSDLGHAHYMGSNIDTSGSVALPDWVSLNGLEYFL